MKFERINKFRLPLAAALLLLGGVLIGTLIGTAIGNGSGEAEGPTPAATLLTWYEPSTEAWFEPAGFEAAPAAKETPVDEDVALVSEAAGEGPSAPEAIAEATLEPEPTAEAPEATQTPEPHPIAMPVEPTPEPVDPTPEPTPENAAPFIINVNPGDGATGLPLRTGFSIKFSEAMEEATTEAALSVTPAICANLHWKAQDTVLLFVPCADWTYGTDVQIRVAGSATDVEGKPMGSDFHSSFSVLRQSTIAIYSQDLADGTVYAPNANVLFKRTFAEGETLNVGTWMRGFLFFKLTPEIPSDLVELQSALVYIKQKDHDPAAYTAYTGDLLVQSVSHFSPLSDDDWGMAPNPLCAKICLGQPPTSKVLSASSGDDWKSVDMTAAVRADWKSQGFKKSSGFRLLFEHDCNGNCSLIGAGFYSGKESNGVSRPYLLVTYTHP
jgi:Bacterial Ig-like domain